MSKKNKEQQQEVKDKAQQLNDEVLEETAPETNEGEVVEGEVLEEEEKLREQVKVLNDKYLRLTAEFDNYRKRTLKERMELIKTASEDVLKQILPVMDNFERGLKSMDESQDIESLKEGVHLIYNTFKEFLKQRGVKEIEAMHNGFDTDLHEAVTKIPAPDKKLKGKVVDVIEKGYLLNEKVIRYAKVVVGD